MNNWYLTTVRFTKEFTDGTLKRVSEENLFNAVSFKDAEERVYKEIGEFVRGEFQVTKIAQKQYADIFHYEDCDTWYDAKINYVVEDADSGKEKKIVHKYLVTAHSVAEACDRIKNSLTGLMASFEIVSISKSKIVEIYPYEPSTEEE